MPPPGGADGFDAAIERAAGREQRASDLTPVFNRLCVEFERQTADAFAQERSPAGEEWPRLAPSTVEARLRKMAKANSRSKRSIAEKTGLARGKLTKSAQRFRNETRLKAQGFLTAGGGNIRILWDTGRLRQSIQYFPKRDGFDLVGVSYLQHHVTGSLTVSNRPPKRNPLVIQKRPNGEGFELIPSAHVRTVSAVTSYIKTGKVPPP